MFDVVVYTIVILFSVLGFLKGFIKELLSVVSYVLAVLFARYFYTIGLSLISEQINNKIAATSVSYIIFLIIGIVIMSMVKGSVLGFFVDTQFNFLNRIAGACFGFMKGFAIVFVIYIVSLIAYPVLNPRDVALQDSQNKIIPPWIDNANTRVVFRYTSGVMSSLGFDIEQKVGDIVKLLLSYDADYGGKISQITNLKKDKKCGGNSKKDDDDLDNMREDHDLLLKKMQEYLKGV